MSGWVDIAPRDTRGSDCFVRRGSRNGFVDRGRAAGLGLSNGDAGPGDEKALPNMSFAGDDVRLRKGFFELRSRVKVVSPGPRPAFIRVWLDFRRLLACQR